MKICLTSSHFSKPESVHSESMMGLISGDGASGSKMVNPSDEFAFHEDNVSMSTLIEEIIIYIEVDTAPSLTDTSRDLPLSI